MSSAVYRTTTPSLAVPPTQNTAPVFEFNCMYTHDVRRKQKRWQDGFLRFHTFNNRTMVYDLSRNFVGDHFLKAGVELQDGDEVTLEGSGVMVQVAEKIGSTETNLTELRRSRKEGSSEVSLSSPIRGAHPPAALASTGKIAPRIPLLKHRSLNALLGAPKGSIGKAAFPTESPFEERYSGAENRNSEASRPAKRIRLDPPSSWNVTRTTTSSKPSQSKERSLRCAPQNSAQQRKKTPLEIGQRKLGTKEVIDLSIDSDEPVQIAERFSSDTLGSSSSPHKVEASVTNPRPIRSSSPAFQRQKTPEVAPRKKSVERTETSDVDRIREPIVRTRASDFGLQVNHRAETLQSGAEKQQSVAAKDYSQVSRTGADRLPPVVSSIQPPNSESSKTLRMTASGPKKKTLLCQEQITKKPTRVFSANTENAISTLLHATAEAVGEPPPKMKSQREQLEERLARIESKTSTPQIELLDKADKSTKPPLATEVNRDGGSALPRMPLRTSALSVAPTDQATTPTEGVQAAEALVAPLPTELHLRRVLSESHNVAPARPIRAPGAPVRFTPSPVKACPPLAQQKKTADQLDAPKTATNLLRGPRKKNDLQRSLSLNTTSNGASTVVLSRPFRAPTSPLTKVAAPEKAADPWSREAFDLFTWRPPGWNEEEWCLNTTDAAIDVAS